MGTPKYPAGFAHFDYVNPQAPKGGQVRLAEDGTFDSFNIIVPRGTPAAGMGYIYDTLMASSSDEVASEYGLIADGVAFPDDFSSVTYRINPSARWHDGTPITPDDVLFSFEALTKNNPSQRFYYSHVSKAEKTGDREVTFTFDQAGNRELPQIVGQLMVLPKHWWTGTDANGKPRDIAQGTLEPPLGSGAYKIKSFAPGRTITYERVKDYWAQKLNVNVGKNNIDEIRYEYFRDDTVMLEAFKADQYDFRQESSAKNWATAYDFPAVRDGRVVLEKFEERARGVMQAFIPNLRRDKFKDPRVRRALNYALDFEGMNRTLFFDQYIRVNSFFSGTELASSGLPQGRELDILNSVKDKLPPEVFTTPYTNPVNDGDEARRNNLREAVRLLKEAGWSVRDEVDPENPPGFFERVLIFVGASRPVTHKVLRNAAGEPFTLEILLQSPAMERVAVFYQPALQRLGIKVSIRLVDSSQYINRIRARDFDMIVAGWGQSLSPGNEQRSFFGSESADREGSQNYAGIKNPAVDALIDKVIYATDREDLLAATRALDRALLWNEYVIPAWTLNYSRTARWNRFGHPTPLPTYSFAFPEVWWFDPALGAKAAAKPSATPSATPGAAQ
ncbi:ABC transporter substrate-binding protein [Xanthobacter tagetidis]|uniref:ABC transporter substrate-binding protein n=2 Tax=Xanthobacter tagetidis TaxID=60216 RepID=A0A3L7A8V0_9HYPH|nr:ABC transporter substrate-binding protein [Xanthobacter tagetidis]